MITIPLNTTSGIRIPEMTPPKKPKTKQTEGVERLTASIREAADMLGISVPHFYPLINDGTIRSVQVGRRTLVSRKSLREFVDGKEELHNSGENGNELQGKKD